MARKTEAQVKRPWTPGRLAAVATGLLLFLILAAGCLLLGRENGELTAAQKRQFAVARVDDVLADDARAEDWTEGLRVGSQQLAL